MKRLMLVLFLTCGSPGRPASGFEGTWSAVVPGPAGQTGPAVTLAFTVQDGKPGGSVSTGDRTFALVDVTIDGQTIAFAVEGEEQNKYTGTLAGDQIKFQVKYPSHENGTRIWPFVATRVGQSRGNPASVDGDWEGDVPRGGGRVIAARFTFRVEGGTLTGTVHAVGDEFPVEKGTISNGSITFKIGGTQGDYSGVAAGDEIQMKVKYDGGEAGRQTLPFVLKRIRD
jgi:uncharacterized Zn-binding protein involved in type VI secretion